MSAHIFIREEAGKFISTVLALSGVGGCFGGLLRRSKGQYLACAVEEHSQCRVSDVQYSAILVVPKLLEFPSTLCEYLWLRALSLSPSALVSQT